MKKTTLKKSLGIALSMAMLAGSVPAPAVLAQDSSNFLTDVNGVPREFYGKVVADNHELIDINITDGKAHKVTVYLLDEDKSGRWSMVDMIDPDTQELLDSQNVYDFSDGKYLSYNVSGHVQLRLTNVWTKRYQESKDTAIQGIFVDGVDAEKSGVAKVDTSKVKKDKAANKAVSINVLGRTATKDAGYTMPFDKEVQSVEIRFNGNVDPSSENIDKITVTKDGEKVAGEMRTSFNSVTFKPEKTMKSGTYTVNIPADVKNSAGQAMKSEAAFEFEVEPKLEIIHFNNALNLQTRRVDVTFNDRLSSEEDEQGKAWDATLKYYDNGTAFDIPISGYGQNAGRLYELGTWYQENGQWYQNEVTVVPSGAYTFKIPAGVESASGAQMEKEYVKEFTFDSTELSAKISVPFAVSNEEPFEIGLEKCIGYNEVRYAFSEEDIKKAEYQSVMEKTDTNGILVDLTDIRGDQTLYVQFRENLGKDNVTESPLLQKKIRVGKVTPGERYTFDLDAAGAYDKDGFSSMEKLTDGVFDLATDEWSTQTGNFVANDPNYGILPRDLEDGVQDAKLVADSGIEYQFSKNIYTDGAKNVATGNGTVVPAPKETGYSSIYVLAAGKSDAEAGTFRMNYSDGTYTDQEIIANYWGWQNNPLDNIVLNNMAVCAEYWSGEGNPKSLHGGCMRQYELIPDRDKTLVSVTLPKTENLIRILAITGQEADTVDVNAKAVVQKKAASPAVSATSGKAPVAKSADVLEYSVGQTSDVAEAQDMSYDDFVETYGDDAVLMNAADVTDVTNIKEVPVGDRNYDESILDELNTTTGGYGDSLYPYARQVEKLMSYKIRMQAYENYELDFEDALEAVRRVDNLTRGIEKKCYVVGWQLNGHDSSFPDFSRVNERHKRPMDETSLDSLHWFIKEAKEKYNTTITLHVNFSDTYTDDNALGQQMKEDQLALRQSDGSIFDSAYVWAGHRPYFVSAYANYFTGNWQKNQMEPLLKMLPELEGQSIHPDAWYTYDDKWYGQTAYDTADAQRRHAKYLRDNHNMDLTTEFEVSFTQGLGFDSDHILYFPMIWQRGWGDVDGMKVPAYFQIGINEMGRDENGYQWSKVGRYFGQGTAVEPNLWDGTYSPINLPGLKQSFAENELSRQYLNTLMRNAINDETETATLYSGKGEKVTSAWSGNYDEVCKRTVTVGDDVVLQEKGNVFMPMVWRANREIQAWSQNGYTDKTWKLPTEWEDVEAVDIYDLNFEGLRHMETVDVVDRAITFDMTADQSAIIVPAGQNPNSTEEAAQQGAVEFVGADTTTGADWTKVYGSEGYNIFDTDADATMPESVEVDYVNAVVETGLETGYVPEESDKVDKSALEKLVEEALTFEKDDYTEDSWTAFEAELKDAQAVLADEDATQEEVNAAYKALFDAKNALVKLDNEPTNPDDDKKPSKPGNDDKDSVETGDSSAVIVWLMIAMCGFAAVCLMYRRKRSN